MNVLQNIDNKTYRLETIIIEEPAPSYFIQKNYVREIEIYFLGKQKEYFKYQILVVDFNFSNDDSSMDEFIKHISYLFDDLELLIDEYGTIVGIENINSLRIKWMELSQKISQIHKGNEINNYFKRISDLLLDNKKLIRFFSTYNMFGLLFNGLLNDTNSNKKRISIDGITEIMTPTKSRDKTILKISAENLEDKKIEHFAGIFKYENNIYEEGFIELKKDKTYFKHSLLWIA